MSKKREKILDYVTAVVLGVALAYGLVVYLS